MCVCVCVCLIEVAVILRIPSYSITLVVEFTCHLFTMPTQAHEGKALCVDWMTGDSEGEQGLGMVSGGSDCLLRSTPVVTSAPSGAADSA